MWLKIFRRCIVADWCFKKFTNPREPELKKNPQIETLVFVLDGNLRNIPMTVLYNGKAEKYLEDKYAIAMKPRLQLFAPQPLQHKLKVFVSGIGEAQNIDGKNFFLRSVVVNFYTNAQLKLCWVSAQNY
ncbi:MAG: CHAT domain-containing protein [Microcoleus sp. T1-bin1]|nr:CHAT domain-containing protein [Microcoleus sp. T1-bin1]